MIEFNYFNDHSYASIYLNPSNHSGTFLQHDNSGTFISNHQLHQLLDLFNAEGYKLEGIYKRDDLE